jgi:hypothetical protein
MFHFIQVITGKPTGKIPPAEPGQSAGGLDSFAAILEPWTSR